MDVPELIPIEQYDARKVIAVFCLNFQIINKC